MAKYWKHNVAIWLHCMQRTAQCASTPLRCVNDKKQGREGVFESSNETTFAKTEKSVLKEAMKEDPTFPILCLFDNLFAAKLFLSKREEGWLNNTQPNLGIVDSVTRFGRNVTTLAELKKHFWGFISNKAIFLHTVAIFGGWEFF